MKQYHHPTNIDPEFESGLIQVVVPKCDPKVAFGVYRSQVDALIADEFLLMAGNISTDPVCTTSYQYLYSSPMVHISSNIVGAFTNNAPYAEKGIYMRSQVCKQ